MIAVSYQNCGEIRPSSEAVHAQSLLEKKSRDDREIAGRLLGSSTQRVWLKGNVVPAVATAALNLTPGGSAPAPSQVNLDLLGTGGLQFSSGANLATKPADDFIMRELSVLALIEGVPNGRIVTVHGGTLGSEELSLKIANNTVTAVHQTSTGNYAQTTLSLGSSLGPFAIAASFGRSADAITLQVNGKLAPAPVITGSPFDSAEFERELYVGTVPGDTGTTNFKIAELMVFTSELKASELNSLARRASSERGFEGVEYIPFTADTGPTGPVVDPVFQQVSQILVTRCAGCHADWANGSASDLWASGRVQRGNAFASPLYIRLTNSEGPSSAGAKSMPLAFGGQSGPLDAAQLTLIKNWINSL